MNLNTFIINVCFWILGTPDLEVEQLLGNLGALIFTIEPLLRQNDKLDTMEKKSFNYI